MNSKGTLPNFADGDFVLIARNDFIDGEKLSLRWYSPLRIFKAMKNYAFQLEDLRNGNVEGVHCSKLKFYHYVTLNTGANLSQMISSETDMVVQHLLEIVE